MEVKILRSFLTVAREQSISGAARLLHISQPSLSRQIMDLEEEIGAKLFQRGNRKITLTEAGMLLRKRAEQIVDLVRKTQDEMASSDKTVSGTVHIGAGETHAFRTVARAIRSIAGRYPDIRFNLFSGNAEDVMERVDKGLVDFGVLIEPYDISKYDYLRLPLVDTWGVIMRQDSPLASLEAIQPEDLLDAPLICSRQALGGGHLSSWFKADYAKLNMVSSYNLLYNAALLAEAGLGYVLCIDNILNTTNDSSLCFRPLKPALTSQVNLIWKKYQIFSRASELFFDGLRSECFT